MRYETLVGVDADGNFTSPVNRYKAHTDGGVLHQGFLIIVKNSKNQIWVTQRSPLRPDLPDEIQPPFALTTDVTIAGHPRVGSGYKDRAIKELEEEIGVIVIEEQLEWLGGEFNYVADDPARLHPMYRAYKKGITEIEVCGTYLVYTDQVLKPDPKEIIKAELLDADQVRREVNRYARSEIITRPEPSIKGNRIIVKKFKPWTRMYSPWFIEAQRLYPQIYEFNPPKTRI